MTLRQFKPEDLEGKRVAVLANVDKLAPELAAALGAFVEAGGGLLIAPGDRLDVDSFNDRGPRGWLPARVGPLRGDLAKKAAVAHPAPRTFDGPALGPLGRGRRPRAGRGRPVRLPGARARGRSVGDGPARHRRPLDSSSAPSARGG